ncbi:MAG: hypothetical protein GY869_19760 [Planctomycetes bacterium]|nr:hypothetical protein [Planctomycetota bacterium]
MIKKVASKSGDFTGVARAGMEIGKVQAINFDNAIISARNKIVKAIAKGNIIDTYILGGYDIGADGEFDAAGGGDDILGSGNVLSVTSKGEFARSFIGAGTLPSAPLTNQLPGANTSDDFGVINKVKFGRVNFNSAFNFGLFAATEINKVNIDTSGAYRVEVF